ncbi:MAG: glutamyl-tRNA reductase [Nitrospiraceae bacterium]|nr:glutamyl-tRNA reductase [Nitrospiraceae bacterium]
MKIIVIGVNHKTANVEVRERLAFNGEKLSEGIAGLRSLEGVNEVAVLSTCNRVELYACVDDTDAAVGRIKKFLSDFHSLEPESFEHSLYALSGTDAVRHILRVASSLDSMVLGEPQILGQLKDAFSFALKEKSSGILLNRLLKKAISTAKRTRTETKIAENAVSISFAAVELAKKIFNDLSGMSCMLLGAGEMAELAARHLVSSGIKEVMVANRTYETGCRLAEEFCGRPVKFEDFKTEMLFADIVICSTGAPTYVLNKDDMHAVMKHRKQKPVFIIDISVPRNIDPEINKLENVYLYDVDDLQEVVNTNMMERQKEADKASCIVEEEVGRFMKWISSLKAVPVILSLREKAEDIKNEEFIRLKNRLKNVSDEDMQAIEYMATAIINKMIHAPMVALKDDCEDRQELIALIKKLYGINGDNDDEE